MNNKKFFSEYIIALEEALEKEEEFSQFNSSGPDWYIKDEALRKEMYLFEEENFKKHEFLFKNVALYFDAISHGFNEINGIKIIEFKKNLFDEVLKYKKRYF